VRRAGGSVGALVLAAAALALAAGARFDLDPFDSAELALVAVTRGLGHPPGQPLHTLLGWLATRGPWRPLAALAWLSMLPTAAMLAAAARHAVRDTGEDAVGPARALLAAGAAVLATALPVVRDAVCRVEVYGLAAALAAGAVLLATRREPRADAGAGLLLGLATVTNPVIAVQGVGALAVLARGPGAVGRAALGAVAGLAVYGYAFAVAGREDTTLVWGAPTDAVSFMAMLTARDFRQNVSLTVGTLAGNLLRLAGDLARGGALPYLVLGAAGLALPARGGRARGKLALAFAWALATGALMLAANVPYRPANPDYGGYLLVPLGLAAVGASRLALLARGRQGVLGLALAVLCALLALPGAVARGRPSGATRVLATEALASLPPRALAVIGSDHLLFPVLYLQQVEGLRRDVVVLNPGWASSSWAWRYAQARDPSLVVDLTPGRGAGARLVGALRAREPGRAVAAESLALLQAAAPGTVCPRGVLWVSSEGCAGASRPWVERVTRVLATEARRAPPASWDLRVVRFTGRALGDGALSLGCPGLAARGYAAALDVVLPAWAPGRLCDGRRIPPPPPADLLEIDAADLARALDAIHAAPEAPSR
jgi:hypothetical protein